MRRAPAVLAGLMVLAALAIPAAASISPRDTSVVNATHQDTAPAAAKTIT